MTDHDVEMLRQRMQLAVLRGHSVVLDPEVVLELLDIYADNITRIEEIYALEDDHEAMVGHLRDRIEYLEGELNEKRKSHKSKV